MEEPEIVLELDEDKFGQILSRYSLEQIKDMAISMALKLYSERPITKEMLFSCLANLESDLEGMYGRPKRKPKA